MNPPSSWRYCGRDFSAADLAHLQELLRCQPTLNRSQLSRQVCRDFGWINIGGQLKQMSCRVALLRMERDGLLQLPKALGGNRNCRAVPALTAASAEQAPVREPVAALAPLQFRRVQTQADSRLWNELIQRYHYLGYSPLSGAQMRYLVVSRDGRLLAALGFGASAWQTKPRDQFIGWDDEQRRRGLQRIVNNARFLILPWVQSPSLASGILSGVIQPLLAHWSLRYGYRPVLLESFVETPRFTGIAYKAANWICVGKTQGRGKLEKQGCQVCAIKQIWLYPLHPQFRKLLRA